MASAIKQQQPTTTAYTAEWGRRMYSALKFIERGVRHGQVYSKPIINHDNGKIESIGDVIREALKPSKHRLRFYKTGDDLRVCICGAVKP